MLSRIWLVTLTERWQSFETILEESLDYSLTVLDLKRNDLKKSLLSLYHHPVLFEDVKSTLDELKSAGHGLFILSNGSNDMLKRAVEYTGLSNVIDEYYSVEIVERYKIHKKAYACVSHLSNLAFVSSNAWDIFGASNFGLRCFWINRVHKKYPYLSGLPQKELFNFRELLDLTRSYKEIQ